jgi:hypothetical protein
MNLCKIHPSFDTIELSCILKISTNFKKIILKLFVLSFAQHVAHQREITPIKLIILESNWECMKVLLCQKRGVFYISS